ncbi:hypothetical protein [Anaeropeptidivorans aminofermentans]|jgi:hypothetical protein|uniref:hypothetical protein n=1 Tax=Anaeropeptidivorans aminofermentans TaxID=2934315 RepID=UPI002024BA37|nr:hypothetical protein [Anaeropeptidivorans aminofermentans]
MKKDIQELHGFNSIYSAKACLESGLFKKDVFISLKPLRSPDSDIKIYGVA